MSVHIEWGDIEYAGRRVEVVAPGEVVDAYGAENDLPALCLDLDGGSVTVLEGTKAQMQEFVKRLALAVEGLEDVGPTGEGS